MEQPLITFVLNGKTFSLRAGDREAIGAIPAPERQQLLALLEAVRQQEEQAGAIARSALDKAGVISQAVPGAAQAHSSSVRPERLGSGDVDALMARLVVEENRNRKPGMTKQRMYLWLLGTALVIALLLLI
jgi:hypothetical protein